MTETVLLAIVKASFSFTVGNELWDQLMALLSSVSSNSDVIDKWIEVIDDLIRQVFKTSYQIDINQTIESKLDKKVSAFCFLFLVIVHMKGDLKFMSIKWWIKFKNKNYYVICKLTEIDQFFTYCFEINVFE